MTRLGVWTQEMKSHYFGAGLGKGDMTTVLLEDHYGRRGQDRLKKPERGDKEIIKKIIAFGQVSHRDDLHKKMAEE